MMLNVIEFSKGKTLFRLTEPQRFKYKQKLNLKLKQIGQLTYILYF